MHGLDLTPTDQVAAMLLLRQVQHARRHRHAQDRLVDPGAAPGKPSTVRCVAPEKVSAPFCEPSLARLMRLPGLLLKWWVVHAGFPKSHNCHSFNMILLQPQYVTLGRAPPVMGSHSMIDNSPGKPSLLARKPCAGTK